MSDTRSLLERESRRFVQTDDAFERLVRRRDHKHRNQRIQAGMLGLAIAVAVAWLGFNTFRSPSIPVDPPAGDLGIFAPAAGRYVVGYDSGIYAIDPAETLLSSTRAQLTHEPGIPLGWSSDGTELLIMQAIRGDRVVPFSELSDATRLVVLHADGSQTLVIERRSRIDGAAISPGGSHVLFATQNDSEIKIVDADGGSAEVLFQSDEGAVSYPTFSPDGAQIAFVVGGGDHSHRVWVMNADGSEGHEILANETTMSAGWVRGLAWSPTGDRIAISLTPALGSDSGTHTFATDGADFTPAGTTYWYWSPDGTRFASGPWHPAA